MICNPADRAGADSSLGSGSLEGETFLRDLTLLKEQIITEYEHHSNVQKVLTTYSFITIYR